MRGRFITVEGGEGAGKSSCLGVVAKVLQAAGVEVVTTREPGGTRLGERVRAILLDAAEVAMVPETELLLMFAARAQHLRELIEPALERGQWVLCDRFTDASYAYQGGGRGIPVARIDSLESWIQGQLRPDLTLLLDVPAREGLARATRGRRADRFEREQAAFYERVRAAYLQRAKAEPQRVRIVDAGQPLPAVRAAIGEIVRQFISEQSEPQ